MARANFIKWILGLIAINVVGLILITIYPAYYSFGTMLFGVYIVAVIKDFWDTKILVGTISLVCANALAVTTTVARQFKK